MHSQQIVRPHTPSYEHHVGEDENEHHHEKKSVLKKVKDKAKKIKDTLKLHGQGHHDHDEHVVHDAPDDHDLDEEDDEDEEMANDPEIHGASGLSSTIRSSVPEQAGDKRNYYGMSEAMKDDSSYPGYSQPLGTGLPKSSLPKQEEHNQGDKIGIERTSNIKDVPYTPLSSPAPRMAEQPKVINPVEEEEAIRGKPDISMANTVTFEEDPDAPKTRPQDQIPTNYETKVANPTGQGTKEIEGSSILHKLGQMDISDDSKPNAGELNAGELDSRQRDQSIFPTGSHDQFSPGPTPPILITSDENPQSVPQQSDASKSEDNGAEKGPIQSSYTQKMASATSAIADRAISAKNMVASKLGYGARDSAKEQHDVQEKSPGSSPLVYGKKIASTVTEKITPVYEKVAETGSNLMSKAHLTRGGNDASGTNIEGQDKGVSVRDYFSEKLRPGEEDRALSEVISEALHKQKNGTEGAEKKLGKVTESEKVKEQLGIVDDSDESIDASAVNVPGSAVVSKLKEVAGSYFGEGGETRSSSQQSLGSNDSGLKEEETREKRLQDSGN
ncbi:CAP160 protein [Euphorbia peplus]|nr:CAP160 protein [Euphorbia peplus]